MADSTGNAAMSAGLGALAASNPYVAAATALFGLFKGHKSKPKLMSYEEALNQAKAQLNPQYTQGLQRALSAFNVNAAARGVNGQTRTQNQMAHLISDSEAQRSGAVASLAQQIMANQNNQNTTNYALQQQYNQNQQAGLVNVLNALTRNGTRTPDWNVIFGRSLPGKAAGTNSTIKYVK